MNEEIEDLRRCLGSVIRDKRREKGYRQNTLAKKANVSISVISNLEGYSEYKAPFNVFTKVSGALGMNLSLLIKMAEYRHQSKSP